MALTAQDQYILQTRIRLLVSPDLLARARAHPSGPYDPDVIEVLDFVRRNPDPDCPRYLIVQAPDGSFTVAQRNPLRGALPFPGPGGFDTRDDAEYAVLLCRLADYGILAGELDD